MSKYNGATEAEPQAKPAWKNEVKEEKKQATRVVYQAQRDFVVLVDCVTYSLKQGEIISAADVIARLLSVSAPIAPMSDDRMDSINCPHCNRRIELEKIPAVKYFMELQKK